MAIKTVLVPLDGSETGLSVLEAAYLAGPGGAAHFDVLYASADPMDTVPLLGEGMSAAMIEDMIEQAGNEVELREKRAHDFFDDFVKRHSIPLSLAPGEGNGASASWIVEQGREDEIIARRGRFADLTIVARPGRDSAVSVGMALNAALFETGRPVLVAPPAPPPAKARRAAVAWNGSAEASRALKAALPILESLESVRVLSLDTDKTDASGAGELKAYLAWHGIEADVQTPAPDGRAVGAVLLEACSDFDADLLVMGGYGHSRMRQLILGGVTRHVLEQATLPVLMAH